MQSSLLTRPPPAVKSSMGTGGSISFTPLPALLKVLDCYLAPLSPYLQGWKPQAAHLSSYDISWAQS